MSVPKAKEALGQFAAGSAALNLRMLRRNSASLRAALFAA